MDWRPYCSCFILLLFFFSFLPGALTSTSLSNGIFVYPVSPGRNLLQDKKDGIFVYPVSPGRNLLQDKKACPISFEFQNYTIITSQCKPPQYPAKQCCDAFLQFACPFAELLNDLSNNCASSIYNYINPHREYPPGFFSSVCQGTKEGLVCPVLAPSPSTDDTDSSQIKYKLSPVLMISTTFMGWMLLLLL